MKEKILNAIDKGLMNVLSADIEDQNIDFNTDDIDSEYIPYEYRTVDMGTGILWCEYNLGAFPGNKPSDWYGDYYAWGETDVKNDYSWETYRYGNGSWDAPVKYNETDNLITLTAEDDVIHKKLGKKFRMPTQDDYQKLLDNTTHEWVKNYKGIYGLNGTLFTAENGNTLFFPASGYRTDAELFDTGKCSSIWASSLYSIINASFLDILSFVTGIGNDCRYYGHVVRGVCELS